MTRKEEQAKWQALALAYYDERGAQGIKEDLDAIREPRDISKYDAIKRLIMAGIFGACFDDMARDISEIYGADYDESRYYTKSGDLKYRGGESRLAQVYRAKMTQAIEKITEGLK